MKHRTEEAGHLSNLPGQFHKNQKSVWTKCSKIRQENTQVPPEQGRFFIWPNEARRPTEHLEYKSFKLLKTTNPGLDYGARFLNNRLTQPLCFPALPLLSIQLQCWPSPIWPDMVPCDPAWLRRRPDQRQRGSLEKTFGLRMDGISVRKPFPLGSLVLGPRDRVTTQKRQHERGGDTNPHTWGSFSACPALGLPPIMYPFFPSAPHPLNSQTLYLCVTSKLQQPNMPLPSQGCPHHHLTLLPKPSPQNSSFITED